VGTGRGVARINPSGSKSLFTTYAPESNSPDSRVTALRESSSGKIWCSTRRALYEWDRANHFRRLEVPLPPHSDIHDVLEDPQGDIWVATSREIVVTGDRGVVATFTPKIGTLQDQLYSLLLDSRGRIWRRRGAACCCLCGKPAALGAWKEFIPPNRDSWAMLQMPWLSPWTGLFGFTLVQNRFLQSEISGVPSYN